MSDQRILSYQVVLIENQGLTISSCEVLNPATLLPTPEGSLSFYSCLETLDHWTIPWEGWSEDPLINPEEIWYTDSSSFVLDGKRRARYSVQFSSVTQLCPTLCDPYNRSTPGLLVHQQLPGLTQTHVRWVGNAVQPSHPLSSPFPPAPNPFRHQSLFQWVDSSHQVAKVLEFQLWHQSFQWIFRTDLL